MPKMMSPANSDGAHTTVLEFVTKMKTDLKKACTSRHKKWRTAEEDYRAYIDIEAASESRKTRSTQGVDYPGTVPIVIPMAMAGVHSYLSFLMEVFGGRRPVIKLGGRTGRDVKPAEKMEAVIEYQMQHDRVRGLLQLFFWFQDALTLGSGFLGANWVAHTEPRVQWTQPDRLGDAVGAKPTSSIVDTIVYEGNDLTPLDPYRVYPDPRVPLSHIQSGDALAFEFTRSETELDRDVDRYFNVDLIPRKSGPDNKKGSESNRQKILGTDIGGTLSHKALPGFPELFELHAKIRPYDLGIGDSDRIELWIFTMANNEIIIGCEKSDAAGELFPVNAIEFLPCGHQFFNQGFVETVAPLQNHFSWLFNSRVNSVRQAMNQTNIFDPSKVDVSKLKEDKIVRWVPLLATAQGGDLTKVVHTIKPNDPTANYGNDLMIILDIYQRLTAITDMVQGLPAKGRRTAFEMSGVQGAATGRLKLVAEIFSLGGVIPLAKMMVQNTQQYMTEAAWVQLLGEEGANAEPLEVNPWDIAGEFNYPVVDGTAPMDKNRSGDVWKEILIGVAGSQELSAELSLFKIFEQLAKTLGIKNVDDFRRNGPNFQAQIQGQDEVAKRAKAGNIVPIEEGGSNGTSQIAKALAPLIGGAGRRR